MRKIRCRSSCVLQAIAKTCQHLSSKIPQAAYLWVTAQTIMASKGTKAMDLQIHRQHFEHCASTNEKANDWLKKSAPGNIGVFTTNHQYAGKGQRGTRWDQAKGLDLAWSMGLNWPRSFTSIAAQQANAWFAFNKAITLATHQTVQDALDSTLSEVRIKWPNDIYISSQNLWEKCGGILIENTWQGSEIGSTVIGIGINALSTELPASRTSIVGASAPGARIDLQVLAKALEVNVLKALNGWQKSALQTTDATTAYLNELNRTFDAALLAKNTWKSYRWKGVEKVGKITAVDAAGRCAMEWQSLTGSIRTEAIENNKQLEWSWIAEQFD